MQRYLRTLVQGVSLLMCFVSGCMPSSTPVWVSDSEGIIYTRDDGAVVHHDLQKQASRVLLAPGDYHPARIAVSPDGRIVAIPTAAWGDRSRAVAVNLVNLSDGSAVASKLQAWGEDGTGRKSQPASAFWCPSGKRILVSYQAGADHPFGLHAVYDVQQNSLTELKSASPALMLTSALDVSPCLPDGSGYLAMKLRDDGPQFFLVDWDGWEYELKVDPEVEVDLKMMGDKQKAENEMIESLFPLSQGSWQGKTLQTPTRRGVFVWDFAARRVSRKPLSEKQQGLYDSVTATDRNDPSWLTYQIEHFRTGTMSILCRMQTKGGNLRIELVDREQNRRRLILEGTILPTLLNRPLCLSPDGKSVLVSLEQGGGHHIHVIRHDGTVVSHIQPDESE